MCAHRWAPHAAIVSLPPAILTFYAVSLQGSRHHRPQAHPSDLCARGLAVAFQASAALHHPPTMGPPCHEDGDHQNMGLPLSRTPALLF